MGLNSCLYDCEVMHYRLKPKKHKLVHKVFMFYLDLDELDSVVKNVPWIGRNKNNVYAFYDKDHFDFGKDTVKENLKVFLKNNGFGEPIERIMLLTNLRTFGYIFNPVSFYFCFNKENQPRCAVVEIGNTFKELKPYFIGPESLGQEGFVSIHKKEFYISPFANLNVKMEFKLKIPSEILDTRVQDIDDHDKFLYATLTGKKQALNKSNIFWYTLKFPLITLKVIGLIHFHAFLLYLKQVPFHKKEENPQHQKGVLRVYRNTAQKYDKSSS